jgi:hypothetical protein
VSGTLAERGRNNASITPIQSARGKFMHRIIDYPVKVQKRSATAGKKQDS